jgi:hypothetical protein
MWSISLFAIIALEIGNHKFNDEALLKQCSIEYFLLYSKLNFYTPRVRLGPNESRIYKLNSFEPFDLFKANSEKLS